MDKYLKYRKKYEKMQSRKQESAIRMQDRTQELIDLRAQSKIDNPISTISQEVLPIPIQELKKESDEPEISIVQTPEPISNKADIGFMRNMTVRLENFSEHSDKLVTLPETNISEDSVLYLSSLSSFDAFTSKYGKLGSNDDDPENEFIYIDWDKVRDKYHGLYISGTLIDDRYENSPFNDNKSIYISWWKNGFIKDGVAIFI